MKKKIAFISLLMVISGITGWIYEVIFYFINSGFKEFYLRGICFLPWIDIYVIGGLLIYLVCNKLKDKPYLVFLLSGLMCGLLEYIVGEGIYLLFDGKRSWNYDTEILGFGSINGFVCLRSVLVFALSGVFLIYVLVPLIKKILAGKYSNIVCIISYILISLFLIDETYNMLIMLKVINLPSAGSIYRSLGFKYMKY